MDRPNEERRPWTAAVEVDGQDRIVLWSAAAEILFGHEPPAAAGLRLQDLLDGRDVFGNRLCHDACWLQDAFQSGEPVQRFELDVRHARGQRIRVVVEVEQGARAQGWCYRFLPDLRHGERRRAPAPRFAASASSATSVALTQRERQVLQLLARGSGTAEIARELGISLTTVRNHTQHLLDKLGAHTRLQAVSHALQHGLL